MARNFLVALLAVAAIGPASAQEEAQAPAVRGTAGLVAVPFSAGNATPAPIACVAALAHWYSQDLGRAAPGASVAATLWADPRDGTLFLLNPLEDRMPVLALACGPADDVWAAGARIEIERRTGQVPAPLSLRCRRDGGLFACS